MKSKNHVNIFKIFTCFLTFWVLAMVFYAKAQRRSISPAVIKGALIHVSKENLDRLRQNMEYQALLERYNLKEVYFFEHLETVQLDSTEDEPNHEDLTNFCALTLEIDTISGCEVHFSERISTPDVPLL